MKQFSVSWFNPGIFERHLSHLRNEPLLILEIGTFEGESACWLLDYFARAGLITIDPCEPYPIPDVASGELIGVRLEEIIKRNLADYGDRVEFFKGRSADVLPLLKYGGIDLAYIDGDHREQTVYSDAVGVFPLLEVGGHIVFDDYRWRYDPKRASNPDSPHDAIDRFISEVNCDVLERDAQVCIRKVA